MPESAPQSGTAAAVVVAEARAYEEPLARSIVRDALGFAGELEPLVARAGIGGPLVGAAFLSARSARDDVPGPGYAWGVTREITGKESDEAAGPSHADVERALLAAACERAWRWGGDAIYSLRPFAADDPAVDRWIAAGFEAEVDRERFAAPIAAVHEHCVRLNDRARSRGRVPDGLTLRDADAAALPRLAPLFAAAFGLSLGDARRRLVDGFAPDLMPACSPIAAVAGRVVGFVVVTTDRRGVPSIPAMAVHPDFRGSAIESVMLAASAAGALRIGLVDVEFDAGLSNVMTRRAADRFGGRPVGRTVYLRRAVGAAA